MAISYPNYKTEINITLKDKITGAPLANQEIEVEFTTEEELLGRPPLSYTTDAQGIINDTIIHQGEMLGISAKFYGSESYDPSNIIELGKVLWKPELNGETGANYQWSYSESNGQAVGKGFVFQNGFNNVDKWQLSFEFRHDDIQYTGICFLAKLGEYNGAGDTTNIALTSWEGSWPGGERYYNGPLDWQSNNDGRKTVDWFDVTVTKIDSTHVQLQSSKLNRNTIVEVSWLPTATQLSFGARHNYSNNPAENRRFGPCRIRNIKVKKLYNPY